MSRVVLLSCTKSKTPTPAPAQELYSASPMFRKTLEYGKTLNPDKMFILSAKHNLVPLNKKLSPYDLTLKDFNKEEKEIWADKTYRQMLKAGLNPEKDTFIFLTGNDYSQPLMKYIPQSNIVNPLEGKKFGQRLEWLNKQLSSLKEVFNKIKNLIHETLKRKTSRKRK